MKRILREIVKIETNLLIFFCFLIKIKGFWKRFFFIILFNFIWFFFRLAASRRPGGRASSSQTNSFQTPKNHKGSADLNAPRYRRTLHLIWSTLLGCEVRLNFIVKTTFGEFVRIWSEIMRFYAIWADFKRNYANLCDFKRILSEIIGIYDFHMNSNEIIRIYVILSGFKVKLCEFMRF